MWPKFRPYQCMRGNLATATPADHATVSLYNNSSIGEMLAVWQFTAYSATDQNFSVSIQKALLGASAGTISPLITEEALKAGQITYVDTPTLYDADFYLPLQTSILGTLTADAPLAILKSGWSLVVQDLTAADPSVVGFIWQTMHREDLLGDDCPICAFIVNLS